MAQLVSPGGLRPTGSVSVADLVSRNAPVPATRPASEPTSAVSVGNLLRRESHAPGAGPDGNEGTRGTVRGAVVRGATIVAGTALVAGSAFGGAVLVETFFLDPAPTAGATPATSAPDGTTAPASTPGALVDRAVAGPDAGTGAPTAWTEVAFPKAVTGGTQARSPAAPVTKSPSTPVRSTSAASAADQKESAQGETSQKESQKESAAPATTSAATADSTSDQPASSSGSTTTKDGGLVGTVVHAVTGVLGLG